MQKRILDLAVRINELLERSLGVRVVRKSETDPSKGMEEAALLAMERANGRTLLDPVQQYSTYWAARYVGEQKIAGDVVEFGVWRGGASLLMLSGLMDAKSVDRSFYLFDTFAGMTEPSERDRWIASGKGAGEILRQSARRGDSRNRVDMRCIADIQDVVEGLRLTNYDQQKIHLVKGDVKETIATNLPATISLVRLDTDWYESTKLEIQASWPRLAIGGVAIIDDYDEWTGARDAIDEYFSELNEKPFLIKSGWGRIAVKVK